MVTTRFDSTDDRFFPYKMKNTTKKAVSFMLQCTKPCHVKIVDHVVQQDVPCDACSNTTKKVKKTLGVSSLLGRAVQSDLY